jgi:hypothetical protein
MPSAYVERGGTATIRKIDEIEIKSKDVRFPSRGEQEAGTSTSWE